MAVGMIHPKSWKGKQGIEKEEIIQKREGG